MNKKRTIVKKPVTFKGESRCISDLIKNTNKKVLIFNPIDLENTNIPLVKKTSLVELLEIEIKKTPPDSILVIEDINKYVSNNK